MPDLRLAHLVVEFLYCNFWFLFFVFYFVFLSFLFDLIFGSFFVSFLLSLKKTKSSWDIIISKNIILCTIRYQVFFFFLF